MNPTFCLFGSRFNRILSSYWAGALLFVVKIRQRAVLFWFELWDSGILQIFYSRAAIQRTIAEFPAFLEHGSTEKIAVCAHTNRDPNSFKKNMTRRGVWCLGWWRLAEAWRGRGSCWRGRGSGTTAPRHSAPASGPGTANHQKNRY